MALPGHLLEFFLFNHKEIKIKGYNYFNNKPVNKVPFIGFNCINDVLCLLRSSTLIFQFSESPILVL